jgi:probable rRNA maturation factor
VDPDSNPPSRRRRFGATGPPLRGGPGLSVSVTDGRGVAVRAGGLTRWLAHVAPARARGEVAIALATDAHVRALNRRYRRKDKATDVLSFPADANGSRIPDAGPRTPGTRQLGDIVIASGVARRQAREAGHSYETELRVLALHGLLHLLGYDHDSPADRGRMARLEAKLRREGGLHEGLIEREGGHAGRSQGRRAATAKKRVRPTRAAAGPRPATIKK